MFKKFFVSMLLGISLPVSAGVLEDALLKKNNVFLYIYTPDCGYCKQFTPEYNRLAVKYKNQYTFIKLDASTPYGYSIMKKFGASYVPFVVLMDGKKNINKQISPNCLLQTACSDYAVNKFIK